MTVVVSPNEADVQSVLRSFLLSVLPIGVDVIEGQDNRVAEPSAADFVVMTAIRRRRVETNLDAYVDAVFTGSIAGTVMTISSVQRGSLKLGSNIFGINVATNTVVASFGTGTGGVGTYNVAPSQSVASRTLSAGTASLTQPTEIAFQLDVHGPNSADNAQIISTAFRDEYAVEQFAFAGFPVTPLYADDPRQAPFFNAEQQYETRWVVEAVLQADQVVSGIPQQFAASTTLVLVNVEAEYPLP